MLVELTELAANIDKKPGEVGPRAATLAEVARGEGDMEAAATAATLAARARRDLREIETAEHAIDQAIASAHSIGGDVLADAHLVAASIATHRRGAGVADAHLAVAEQHASPSMLVKIRVQQAILAYRAGRLDEAASFYERAMPSLRANGDTMMLARVLSNRGLVHTLRGDLAGAVTDFEEARMLFEAAGQEVAVAFVLQNHGEALARLGVVPEAVQHLDDAMRRLADRGQSMYDAESSKAEAFLSAGLFADAAELLSHAIDGLRTDGDRAGAARAMLLRSVAVRLAGEVGGGRAAERLSRRAQHEFADLGLDAYEAQAALEGVRARVATDGPDPSALADAEELANLFTQNGHVFSAIEALSLSTLLSLAQSQTARAASFAQRCEALATSAPFVEHRLAATHATAALDVACGRSERALRSINMILDEFDRFRTTIGAPDGRRASMLHVGQLVELGGRIVGTRDANTVLDWTECRRRFDATSARRTGPGSTAADSVIGELRSVIAELRQVETGPAPSGRAEAALIERRCELERHVTECLLPAGTRPDVPARQPDDGVGAVGQLVASTAFDGTTGVSFDVFDDALLAVVVRDGDARLVRLGDAASAVRTAESARALLSALAREARPGPRRDALGERLDRALTKLNDLVVEPLGMLDGPVVLSLPDGLQAAPWSALGQLHDRPVTIVASLGRWVGAHNTDREPSGRPARVAAIAGPRLVHATDEVAAVARCYDSSGIVAPADSPAAHVIEAFHRADVVHIASHARLRSDNPMWSTIELAEAPLFAHRLMLDADPPSLVVLSSCESAVSTGLRGTPLSGFASALVESGVDSVIAAVAQVPDSAETVAAMTLLHCHIAAGVSPSVALAKVRRELPESIVAKALVCWGQG